jgi:methionine-rich copper-binding protein CopC
MVNFRFNARSLRVSFFITLLGFLTLSSPAYAHMGVSSSNPANGSSMASAPREATIKFNTLVDLDTVEAQLRYIGGVDVALSESTNREVRTEPLVKSSGESLGSTATFELPELGTGFYALDWAVNESGGHSNTSSILFKVTGSKDSSPASSSSSSSSSNSSTAFKFVGPGLVVILILVIYAWLSKRDE